MADYQYNIVLIILFLLFPLSLISTKFYPPYFAYYQYGLLTIIATMYLILEPYGNNHTVLILTPITLLIVYLIGASVLNKFCKPKGWGFHRYSHFAIIEILMFYIVVLNFISTEDYASFAGAIFAYYLTFWIACFHVFIFVVDTVYNTKLLHNVIKKSPKLSKMTSSIQYRLEHLMHTIFSKKQQKFVSYNMMWQIF